MMSEYRAEVTLCGHWPESFWFFDDRAGLGYSVRPVVTEL